jgi:hypothetical protein
MHNIESLLASIEWPGSYIDINLESNFIENKLADQIYNRLMRHGNVLFDTYGMWDCKYP